MTTAPAVLKMSMWQGLTGAGVEIHPRTDAWMQGDRYGEVIGVARDRGRVRVRLDKSGRERWFRPEDLTLVED